MSTFHGMWKKCTRKFEYSWRARLWATNWPGRTRCFWVQQEAQWSEIDSSMMHYGQSDRVGSAFYWSVACADRKRRMKTAADTNMYAPLVLLFFKNKKREREIKRKIGQHLLGNRAPSMDNKSAATLVAPVKSAGRGKFDCARSAWAAKASSLRFGFFLSLLLRCRLLRCYQRHLYDFFYF